MDWWGGGDKKREGAAVATTAGAQAREEEGEDRTTNVTMGHRGDDANEILTVTDGIVDAVRDAERG